MSEVVEIKLPRLSVNDDEYTFVERLVEEGAEVVVGTVIASVESAKTVFEIEAPVAGFVFFLKAARDLLVVGESIALISQTPELHGTPNSQEANLFGSQAPLIDDPAYAKFTIHALELVRERRIDPGHFRHLDLVTSADVEAYLSREAPP